MTKPVVSQRRVNTLVLLVESFGPRLAAVDENLARVRRTLGIESRG